MFRLEEAKSSKSYITSIIISIPLPLSYHARLWKNMFQSYFGVDNPVDSIFSQLILMREAKRPNDIRIWTRVGKPQYPLNVQLYRYILYLFYGLIVLSIYITTLLLFSQSLYIFSISFYQDMDDPFLRIKSLKVDVKPTFIAVLLQTQQLPKPKEMQFHREWHMKEYIDRGYWRTAFILSYGNTI